LAPLDAQRGRSAHRHRALNSVARVPSSYGGTHWVQAWQSSSDLDRILVRSRFFAARRTGARTCSQFRSFARVGHIDRRVSDRLACRVVEKVDPPPRSSGLWTPRMDCAILMSVPRKNCSVDSCGRMRRNCFSALRLTPAFPWLSSMHSVARNKGACLLPNATAAQSVTPSC